MRSPSIHGMQRKKGGIQKPLNKAGGRRVQKKKGQKSLYHSQPTNLPITRPKANDLPHLNEGKRVVVGLLMGPTETEKTLEHYKRYRGIQKVREISLITWTVALENFNLEQKKTKTKNQKKAPGVRIDRGWKPFGQNMPTILESKKRKTKESPQFAHMRY